MEAKLLLKKVEQHFMSFISSEEYRTCSDDMKYLERCPDTDTRLLVL